MARTPPADEPDERADDGDDDDEPAPRRHAGASHSARGHHRPAPLRAWDEPATGSDDPESETPGRGHRKRKPAPEEEAEPVYLRLRDRIWFEPLVALVVIAILLGALFAYTGNWPPVYVVESESMQHGYDDQLGLINTGDLILAQHVDTSAIVPYAVGMQTGYSSYGEYGDVILYHPNGNGSVPPIIHRAILYLQFNPAATSVNHTASYSIPELAGLPCGNAATAFYYLSDPGHPTGCGDANLRGTLTLYRIGWESVDVAIPLDPSILGAHSGFLTMGDNNFAQGSTRQGQPDQTGALSTLVEDGWILGVARGMIPWFGAIKLALDGNAGEVPSQSWQYMGLTVVAIIVAALGLHLFLRREGYEDDRRKMREEQEAADEEAREREKAKAPKRRGLHLWSSSEDDDPPDEPAPPKHGRLRKHPPEAPDDASEGGHGRPRPSVGRKAPKSKDPDDDL